MNATFSPKENSRLVRLRRFRALVRKEVHQIARDPSSILIALVLPLILLFLFGYAVSLDATITKIAVVVEDPGPLTRGLVASFRASRYFDVVIGHDQREFTEELVRGRVRGIVVIPETFAEDIQANRAPRVQIIVDGSQPNMAEFVQNYAQGVINRWSRIQAASRNATGTPTPSAPAIVPKPRFWFNAELTSRNVLVPGSIAIVMTLVGTLLTSLVIAREWERGTMEAMMATPVTAVEMLAGKILPYFCLGLISMTLCTVTAVLFFDVPFRGSLLALYALAAAFLIPALGQGLLISSVTKNQFLASQVALLTGFLPAFLLSGFLFEIRSMPEVIQWITLLVPARYLIPSLLTVFLAGNLWSMFLRAIAILLAAGGVLLLLTIYNTQKRIS